MVDHGRTGFLAEAGNVEELAELLCRLLRDDRLRREMGIRARCAATPYSARIVAEQTFEVYRRAVVTGRSAPSRWPAESR